MNDKLISIQDAIDALIEWYGCEPDDMDYFKEILAKKSSAQPEPDEWCTDCKEYDSEKHCCPRFNKVIRNALKDAQPEPKKGKWIGGELGYCTCCGHEGCASDMWSRCEKPHCPNCGAEMEGVQT